MHWRFSPFKIINVRKEQVTFLIARISLPNVEYFILFGFPRSQDLTRARDITVEESTGTLKDVQLRQLLPVGVPIGV